MKSQKESRDIYNNEVWKQSKFCEIMAWENEIKSIKNGKNNQ